VADYDSADLLARFKRYQRRPTADEKLDTAGVYTLLSEAQAWLVGEIASHCPQMLLGAPVVMTTPDSGLTYEFGDDAAGDPIFPPYAEVYATAQGREMYATTFSRGTGDFVIEGDRIRVPNGRTGTATPYARFITPATAISASVEPIARIKPKDARLIIVWKALENWCAVGGEMDPTPFTMELKKLWCPAENRGTYLWIWKRQHNAPSHPRDWANIRYIDAIAASNV